MNEVSLHLGDCLEVLRTLPAESVDALVTDPPYALNFMGKAWDKPGKEIDASFANWLAGFTDGEGCFRIHREKGGDYYACHFSIKMRRDDKPILERIRRIVGAGRVFDEDYQSPDRPGSEPQTVYLIQDRAGCVVIRDLFMRFPLRAKKLKEFKEWAAALDDWLNQGRGNRWHGPADKSAMERRWLRMKRLREYRDSPWSGHPYQDWTREWAEETLRVLKPGGHGLVMGGTRTYHRLANGLEDAGFDIVDCLTWIYGSGFPKSKNLDGDWKGWGTALKPAHEQIVLIRKPLAQPNVASQVLATGTGALNVDGCRVGMSLADADFIRRTARPNSAGKGHEGAVMNRPAAPTVDVHPAGRWPANLVLSHSEGCRSVGVRKVASNWREHKGVGMGYHGSDSTTNVARGHADPDGTEQVEAWECVEGCPVAELDRQSGERPSPGSPGRRDVYPSDGGVVDFGGTRQGPLYFDSGGASRFFYTAKASSSERSAGLHRPGDRNAHPTVKPIELMRWLCRLITPPGGTILDPFMGSGSTGVAAKLEGFDFIGIEKDAESFETARKRLGWAVHEPGLFEEEVTTG